MPEWKSLTSDEIAALDRRLPVLIPVGLVEAHGPHLAVSVDCDTAEYFSREIADAAGAVLAPLFPYGFADEMAEYPGTIGLELETAAAAFAGIASHFCRHGFLNIVFLSGHGANQLAFNSALYRVWAAHPDARMAYWNYWTEAGYTKISHADQAETEIALAVGTRSRMPLAKDFRVERPWYRIRSRAELHPETGGINGSPSLARVENGERLRDDIVGKLAAKLRSVVEESLSGSVR